MPLHGKLIFKCIFVNNTNLGGEALRMKNVGIIKENFDLAHKFTKLLNIKEMNAVELPLYNSVHINSLVLSAAK